jgi:hypothetical protein
MSVVVDVVERQNTGFSFFLPGHDKVAEAAIL